MLLSTQCVRPVNQSVHVLLIGPGTSHKIYHGDTCSSLLHVVLTFEEDRMEKTWTMIYRIYCSVFLAFKFLRRRPFSCSGHLSSKCMEFHTGSIDRSGVERAIGFIESLVRSKDLSTAPTMVVVLQPHCYW